MRITYDKEADALHIAFGEGPATVEEVAEGIALDWDSEGRPGDRAPGRQQEAGRPRGPQALRPGSPAPIGVGNRPKL